MTVRRYIAAFSLLASVLLGGLIAPLSHFAYMAWSDSSDSSMAEMGMESMASMNHGPSELESDGSIGIVSTGPVHFECPFAAFFLSQASAVSSDAAVVTAPFVEKGTCEITAESLASRAVPALIARGPPSLPQISA